MPPRQKIKIKVSTIIVFSWTDENPIKLASHFYYERIDNKTNRGNEILNIKIQYNPFHQIDRPVHHKLQLDTNCPNNTSP